MSDIVARLRIDYCSCSDGFKSRRLVDPHCESCQTKDWRDEAADEIERLRGIIEEQRLTIEALNAVIGGPGSLTTDNLRRAADQPDAAPRVKRAYYETHEPPHCPSCRCGLDRHPGYVIGNHWLESAYERICAGEAEAEVLADYGVTRAAGPQAPIIRVSVDEFGSARVVKHYAPGLPFGEHELYCEPESIAPMLRDHRRRGFMDATGRFVPEPPAAPPRPEAPPIGPVVPQVYRTAFQGSPKIGDRCWCGGVWGHGPGGSIMHWCNVGSAPRYVASDPSAADNAAAQPAATREHSTSADCWCNPTVDYVDPETGATVYVHHEPY